MTSFAEKSGRVVLTVNLTLTLLLSVPALTQICATVLSMSMITKSVSLSQPVDSHREAPATTTMAKAVSATGAAMVATRTLVAIGAVNSTRSMVMINVTMMVSRVHLSVRAKVQARSGD